MTQDNTTAAPVCYRHPDRSTLLKCSRCGRPICVSCSIDASVGQRCPECLRTEGTQKIIPTSGSRANVGIPATKTFIALAVVFFVLGNFGGLNDTFVQNLAQFNPSVAAGDWWLLFTPILLHGSFMHLLFNMWALWVLGPQVERGVGSWPFVSLYLASAAVGGVFLFYLGSPSALAVGASGAIFGLFGIWLNWALHRRGSVQGRALLRQIGFLLLLNAVLPFMLPGIAWQAHLGGLIAGFVIGEIWSRLGGNRVETLRTVIGFAVAIAAVVAVLI